MKTSVGWLLVLLCSFIFVSGKIVSTDVDDNKPSNSSISDGQSCGNTFSSPSGILKSENHPNEYPPNSFCSNVISVQGASSFHIQFDAFETELRFDHLYYGEGSNPDVSNSLGVFTGFHIPDDFTVESDTLWFLFTSDTSVNGDGYELTWTATVSEAELECENNTMVAYIPKAALVDVISADELSLIDDSCVSENFNATHYRVSSAFDECGTTAEVQNGYIVMSNVIMNDVIPVSPGQGFTRDRRVEIPIQCYMSQYGQGVISFHPDTSKIIYHEEEFGEFSFQLQLYPNSAYMSPYPSNKYPIEVHLKDRLYFEARVDAQSWLQLFVDSCVATQSTNPYSNPRFEFINDGCSFDNTVEFHSSGDPLIQRFSWEALGAIGNDTSIYVHCFLMLCNASDSSSRCSRGCQHVSKRDVSARGYGSKSYLMTQGPLIGGSEDQQNHAFGNVDVDNFTTNVSEGLLVFFAIAFTTLVCLVAFLVVVIVIQKVRNDKKSSDGYKLVPTSGSE